ncbi:GH36-type glycosyl hydrolase domain-containing protein [Proteiniclasticum sp.]|uniref:GH36-type glycosyl hydrolase domain-containing protein n=1 Tax=Proteiniclasticum sp. TaxID=2053595 RepID=UPI0028990200|nr:cellobiose phosphorylase [Proteiniclasticum sp.]
MIRYNSKEDETFSLNHPELTSYLYFPLANENGVMSSVTPNLSGDSKISQNAFLMPPVSSENLHNDKSSRNFWVRINGSSFWSATGKSSKAQSELFTDEKEATALEAGFMYHKLTRVSKLGLTSEIMSFVPSSGEMVEITGITLKNTTEKPMTIELVSAIPVFGRSADNIRDHRHVTSLLNRIETTEYGVTVKPTMSFDERGHHQNTQVYGVFGGREDEKPRGFIPTVEEFIGEGGSLENPGILGDQSMTLLGAGETAEGYEALGGIVFNVRILKPGESIFYTFILGYGENKEDLEKTAVRFMNRKMFDQSLEETRNCWREKVNITYATGDDVFNHWMKWVSFQPFLRRIYGCSFLPHHDYGKGGRGWRDLWQDCLALLIMDPKDVRKMLLDNYGGVRIDGTNATIIGFSPGEFIADRNNITRVWMDHGMWPFLTTSLYIQQTGDLDILTEETTYFHDMQISRGEEKDLRWNPINRNRLMDQTGQPYRGSVLEHILIEHLTAFYDVGEHGHMRLRGADWNDALDMARENGESVAFTSMYAYNMEEIAELLKALKSKGTDEVLLHKGLLLLLKDGERNPSFKKKLLKDYCMAEFTGEKISFDIEEIINSLESKAAELKENIRKNEWIECESGLSWYNGYYDNSGNKVEGDFLSGKRMMLTSQVFTVMSHTADGEELTKIIKAADELLYDASIGGYKLNTNFNEVKMDLGRMFGFAYGHKENGAVFSHMAVMYGYALYKRGKSEEAFKVISSLYSHCSDFEKSRIYPGIPEYIDAKGRGLYHYLTGSASWMLLTVITQMFGVSGKMGDLSFRPQLLREQFGRDHKIHLDFPFYDRKLKLTYVNESMLEAGSYKITKISIDDEPYINGTSVDLIRKEDILRLDPDKEHHIVVELS